MTFVAPMAQLKLRKTGNSLSTTWPKKLLARLNVKEGERLFVIETRHGVMVTPYVRQFERTMQNADQVIERFKRAYQTTRRRPGRRAGLTGGLPREAAHRPPPTIELQRRHAGVWRAQQSPSPASSRTDGTAGRRPAAVGEACVRSHMSGGFGRPEPRKRSRLGRRRGTTPPVRGRPHRGRPDPQPRTDGAWSRR